MCVWVGRKMNDERLAEDSYKVDVESCMCEGTD